MPLWTGHGGIVKPTPALYVGHGGIVKPATQLWAGHSGLVKPVFDAVEKNLAFITDELIAGAQTTYTFSNVSVGAADPNREIVVATICPSAQSRALQSGSIAGTSATIHTTTPVLAASGSGIMSARIPTGTTANISVTWNGSTDNGGCRIFVYRLIIAEGSFLDENSSNPTGNATSNSVALNTAADGVALWISMKNNTNTQSFNTGTKNFEVSTVAVGSWFPSSAASPRTITASWSGSVAHRNMSAASWL